MVKERKHTGSGDVTLIVAYIHKCVAEHLCEFALDCLTPTDRHPPFRSHDVTIAQTLLLDVRHCKDFRAQQTAVFHFDVIVASGLFVLVLVAAGQQRALVLVLVPDRNKAN